MDSPWALKQAIREQAVRRRLDQPDKDALSAVICGRFAALPAYRDAGAVMLYVGVRSEVGTRPFLLQAIAEGKRVAIPYCVGRDLELFHFQGMEELAASGFGLLEPRPGLRADPKRRVDPAELDVVMVPGVAFDRRGGRLGHGKGYYDRWLPRVRRNAPLVAVAFECQLFPEIPVLEHDIFMDQVITEKAIYEGPLRIRRSGGTSPPTGP